MNRCEAIRDQGADRYRCQHDHGHDVACSFVLDAHRCDRCDGWVRGGRFRHEDCPPPPIPLARCGDCRRYLAAPDRHRCAS